MATIGVLTLELRLENSHSLKDKRHVVKSLKDRLRHKFNVAVAEIEYQDLWKRARCWEAFWWIPRWSGSIEGDGSQGSQGRRGSPASQGMAGDSSASLTS